MTAPEHTGDDTAGGRATDAWLESVVASGEALSCFTAAQLAARDAAVRADAVAGVLALADERLTTIAAKLIRASYDDDVERMAAALGNGSLAVKAEVNRLRAAVAPHTTEGKS